MKRLVEFPLESGGGKDVCTVEIDVPLASGFAPAARPGEMVARAADTLEAALGKVRIFAGAIVGHLRSAAHTPDDICVEFGIKLSAEMGIILAAGAVEANYRVTLKWKGRNSP